MSETLDTRRKALEDQFFAQQDQKLLEQLREREAAQAAIDALRNASGITDEAVLNELVGLGIRSDTLAALSLIPLVAVAWADGVMEAKERTAILSAAADVGVEAGDVSHELLGSWLDARPGRALVDAWPSPLRRSGSRDSGAAETSSSSTYSGRPTSDGRSLAAK